MIQLTELQSMRDTLQRAIFSGTRLVQFTDPRGRVQQRRRHAESACQHRHSDRQGFGADTILIQRGHSQQRVNECHRQNDRLFLAGARLPSRAVSRGDPGLRIRRREIGASHGWMDCCGRRCQHGGRGLPVLTPETDQIVTVAVEATPIYDTTNGIITAVVKCSVDAIC